MAGEWQETPYGQFSAAFAVERLANLCDPEAGIQTGPFGSQLHQEDYVPIGTPVITVEHLGENRILHEGVPRVCNADRERLSRYLLRRGDIVFSRVGSVDRRALVREPEDGWLFSGRCLRVRPHPAKIDAQYLSYFFGLPAFKEHIRAIAVGATMPSLNTSLLSDVVIAYPSDINEQRAIAHILGALDDKIELNRRMNETLEAMARAIFKSWFIDFDPVRRNLARRGSRNQPSPQPSPKGRGSFRGGYDFAGLLDTARELRSKQTPAEEILWQLVRNRRFMGLKFRRQHQIGDYIADFYCHDRRLVVELDGGVHSTRQQKDHKRDAWLEARGYHVMRFSNNEVLEDPQSVLDRMAQAVIKVGPFPLAEGLGEGPVEQRLPSPAGRRERDEGSVEELDRLFPDSFQDSPLGKIPKGWKVGTVCEDFRLTMGQSPPGETYNEDGDGLAFFQGKTDFGFRFPSKRIYCTAPTRLADPGDTLVSVRAPVGAINMANVKCCIGRGVAALRHKSGSRSYTFYAVHAQKEAFEQFEAEGTVFGSIGRKDFEGIPCVSPPVGLIEKFEQMAFPFDQLVENNERESRTLAAIRDVLLPKLISGEIRVKDALKRALDSPATGD